MKTPPDKTVTFIYSSHPAKDVSWRWEARLTFPAGADETTALPLEIANGEGEPVTGTFELSGRQIPVKDGRGALRYADFVAGKHATSVWLHRRGVEPIPGSLTFA